MQKFLAPILSTLAILGVVGSYFFLYSLNQKIDQITPLKEESVEPQSSKEEADFECKEECKAEIERVVNSTIATISATPKTTYQAPSVPSKTQTVYIPLDGPVITTSTQWVDIPGVEVYIDLVNDYSAGAKVSWEASLQVKHGNGQAFARLQDVTHGITLLGSEISTTNNSTAQSTSSGNFSLWSGRNLYRLQLKSLNSFEVTFLSGRIKVTY